MYYALPSIFFVRGKELVTDFIENVSHLIQFESKMINKVSVKKPLITSSIRVLSCLMGSKARKLPPIVAVSGMTLNAVLPSSFATVTTCKCKFIYFKC